MSCLQIAELWIDSKCLLNALFKCLRPFLAGLTTLFELKYVNMGPQFRSTCWLFSLRVRRFDYNILDPVWVCEVDVLAAENMTVAALWGVKQCSRDLPTFRRNMLLPSSRQSKLMDKIVSNVGKGMQALGLGSVFVR